MSSIDFSIALIHELFAYCWFLFSSLTLSLSLPLSFSQSYSIQMKCGACSYCIFKTLLKKKTPLHTSNEQLSGFLKFIILHFNIYTLKYTYKFAVK